MTHEEYLAFERRSPAKHELLDGEVLAISGARRTHDRVAGNVITELSNALRERPRTVYTSDQHVRAADGSAHYPDVSALCGDERFTDDDEDELTNPTVVVEVLSKTTEAFDRGDTFAHYRSIPSLREYVLASSDKAHVEVFVRESRRVEAPYLRSRRDVRARVARLHALGRRALSQGPPQRVTRRSALTPGRTSRPADRCRPPGTRS